MGDIMEPQFHMEMLHHRTNTGFLIPAGYDDAQQAQWLGILMRTGFGHAIPQWDSQSGF